MPVSDTAAAKALAELTAHKFTCQYLMKCLSATIAGMAEPARSLAIESIEGQFQVRRGEWLAVVSPDTDPALQIAGNRAMSEALQQLATELHTQLLSTPGQTPI